MCEKMSCEICDNITNAIDDDEKRHAIERRDEINAMIFEHCEKIEKLMCEKNVDIEFVLSQILH